MARTNTHKLDVRMNFMIYGNSVIHIARHAEILSTSAGRYLQVERSYTSPCR